MGEIHELEKIRAEHRKLLFALKKFENELPEEFEINQDGVIVYAKNPKECLQIKLEMGTYININDTFNQISTHKILRYFKVSNDIQEFIHDFYYCIYGIAYADKQNKHIFENLSQKYKDKFEAFDKFSICHPKGQKFVRSSKYNLEFKDYFKVLLLHILDIKFETVAQFDYLDDIFEEHLLAFVGNMMEEICFENSFEDFLNLVFDIKNTDLDAKGMGYLFSELYDEVSPLNKFFKFSIEIEDYSKVVDKVKNCNEDIVKESFK